MAQSALQWTNVWSIQADTGDLYHNGEPTGNKLFSLAQGDTITLEYNSSSKVLSFGKNDGEVKKAFSGVFVVGQDLSPFVYFFSSEGQKKV